MNIQYWYTECRGSLVLVVVGHVDPHQYAGAPHLLALTGGELDHQPSLPPGLQGEQTVTRSLQEVFAIIQKGF